MARKPLPRTVHEATRLTDLRAALSGWDDPVAWGVGWDGAVYIAARRSSEDPSRPVAPTLGASPGVPTDYLVLRWCPTEVRTLIHRAELLVVHHVQPFGGGVLLVGARCRWRPEGAEKNAVAIDWNDHEAGRFTLGDGIADVRVTREDTIWVSFYDEGTGGNYGWGFPGAPPPMGASGLLAFDATGTRCFAYDAAAAGTDTVCEAYATNVDEAGTVWIYFYTEFPIVRIQQGRYRSWKLGAPGARALAAQGDRVLLYGDDGLRGGGRLVRLGARGDARVVGELSIVGPGGASLEPARALGVGARLFLLHDRQVYVVDDW